ncbi:MAG: hypothetical protein O3B11_04205 [Bacteroidetes bacterium]|nr:hypothetical protein [Bacteroidota bacterium]
MPQFLVALSNDSLRFGLFFWMPQQQLQALFIHFAEEGMDRTLNVIKR